MSPVKHTLITLGVALMIVSGGSAVAGTNDQITPIVIAREAEAVGRAVRIWKKRPIPTIALRAPGPGVVASRLDR